MICFNEVKFHINSTNQLKLFFFLIIFPVIPFLYHSLLSNLPLEITNDKKSIFTKDLDYLQYYSPFIFLILSSITIYIQIILIFTKIVIQKYMRLVHNYYYVLYINRQINYKIKILLTILKLTQLFQKFFILTIFIFTLLNICLFYPNRFNENLSNIYTIGFLLISTLFFFFSFIYLLGKIISSFCESNNVENLNNTSRLRQISLIKWLNRNLFEIPENTLNDFFCAICQMDYTESITISPQNKNYVKIPQCNHYFHFNCLNKWFQLKPSCPLCNQQIQINSSTPTQSNS